jgi:hypothetical protein
MRLQRLRALRLRQRVILLVLPVLAFRLLVPEGFMPAFGDEHGVTMQMCHGDGRSATAMRLLHDAPDTPPQRQGPHHAPCIFAAAGAVASAEPPTVALEASAPVVPVTLPPAAVPALALRHCPQAPRAPPSPA